MIGDGMAWHVVRVDKNTASCYLHQTSTLSYD